MHAPTRSALVLLALLPALALPSGRPAAAAEGSAEGVAPALVGNDRLVQLRGSGEQTDSVVPPRRPALRGSRLAASSTFSVTYSGFTNAQRDAFQAAVDTWSRVVSSAVPIRIDARALDLPRGVLGAAGPTGFLVDPPTSRSGAETLVPIALANARAGRDLAPREADIEAEFSSDPGLFSYGPDPVPGRYDFTTVVLHEIGHGLGFGGAMEVVADRGGVQRGYWNPGTSRPRPLVFDRSTALVRGDGSLVPLLSLQRGSVALAQALTSGRVVWTGRAGQAANGGRPVELYTPDEWEEGSSYSHLDEDTYATGTPNSLMTPSIDLGEVVRDPGAVSLGILADLGWRADVRSLRVTGPSNVAAGSRVAVTGVARPGSTVLLWFRRRGQTATGPGAAPGHVLQRTLTAGADGTFATSFVATDDHRYYAQVGDEVSEGVLTQVRPTLTGALVRAVPRGSTVSLTGRGQPGTDVRLRYTRTGAADVVRRVRVGRDGTWHRAQVLVQDLRVTATGANGLRSHTAVLLRAR